MCGDTDSEHTVTQTHRQSHSRPRVGQYDPMNPVPVHPHSPSTLHLTEQSEVDWCRPPPHPQPMHHLVLGPGFRLGPDHQRIMLLKSTRIDWWSFVMAISWLLITLYSSTCRLHLLSLPVHGQPTATGTWSSLTTFMTEAETGCEFDVIIQDVHDPAIWYGGCTVIEDQQNTSLSRIIMYSATTQVFQSIGPPSSDYFSITRLVQDPVSGSLIYSDGAALGVLIYRPPFTNETMPEVLLSSSNCSLVDLLINERGLLFVACYAQESIFQFNVTSLEQFQFDTDDECQSQPMSISLDGPDHLFIGCQTGVLRYSIITSSTPMPPPMPQLVVNATICNMPNNQVRLTNLSNLLLLLCNFDNLILTDGMTATAIYSVTKFCPQLDSFQLIHATPQSMAILLECTSSPIAEATILQISNTTTGISQQSITPIQLIGDCLDLTAIVIDRLNPYRFILGCSGGSSPRVIATEGRSISMALSTEDCLNIGSTLIDPFTGTILFTCETNDPNVSPGGVIALYGPTKTTLPISTVCPWAHRLGESNGIIYVGCLNPANQFGATSVYSFSLSSPESFQLLFNSSTDFTLIVYENEVYGITSLAPGSNIAILAYFNGTALIPIIDPSLCTSPGALLFTNTTIGYLLCEEGLYRVSLIQPYPLPQLVISSTIFQILDIDLYVTRNEIWFVCGQQELLGRYNTATDQITIQPFPYDCLVLTLDQRSNRIFLNCQGDGGQYNGYPMLYDTGTQEIVNPLISMSQCTPNQFILDPITEIVYVSCFQGSLFALSQHFQCQIGSQWVGDGCSPCQPGSARGFMNLTQDYIPTCQTCTPGSIAILSGSAQCDACPSGRYQDSSVGEGICAYCPPGRYQPETGQIGCRDCSSGTYSSDIGYTICSSCPPGSYTAQNRSTTCVACDRGTASNSTGLNSTCPQCMPGTEQTQYGGTTCVSCQLGSYAPAGESCSGCPLNSYQPTVGSECLRCDGPDQLGLSCLSGLASVKPGWWAYQSYDTYSNGMSYHTTPCPPNYCLGSPLQILNSTSSDGTDSSIQLCQFPRLNSPQNWLCGECADGFIVWGQTCSDCSSSHIGIILLLLFLGFLLVGFLLRSGTKSAGRLDILFYFDQTAALELHSAHSSGGSSIQWLQVLNLNFLSFDSCFGNITPLQQTMITYLAPFFLIAILMVIGLCHWFAMKLPRISHFFTRFSIDTYIGQATRILLFCYTTVTVAVVQSFNCVTVAPGISLLFYSPTIDCNSSAYHAFLPISIIWLIVYVCGFPLAIWIFLYRHRKNLFNTPNSHPIRVASSSFDPTINLNTSLNEPFSPSSELRDPSYNNLSSATIQLNDSLTITDATLESDMDLTHTSSGRPLSSFTRRWGVLYLGFRHDSTRGAIWWWESWILLRRLAFALTAVLLNSSDISATSTNTVRITFLLFASLNMISLLIHEWIRPFQDDRLNQWDTISYILLFIITQILAGASQPYSLTIVVLLFILILPFTIYLVFWSLHQTGSRLHGQWQRARQVRKERRKQMKSQMAIRADAMKEEEEEQKHALHRMGKDGAGETKKISHPSFESMRRI